MKNYSYFLSIIFCLLITSCEVLIGNPDQEPDPKPEIPELTEATMEGKHTLSFLVDGEVWVSDRGWGDLTSQISVSGKNFSVGASKEQDFLSDYFTMKLILLDFTPNFYTIENTTFEGLFAGGLTELECLTRYDEIESDPYNQVDVTWIDNDNNNIAGTFQFRVVNTSEECTDTIYITDGRFDIQFQATE